MVARANSKEAAGRQLTTKRAVFVCIVCLSIVLVVAAAGLIRIQYLSRSVLFDQMSPHLVK